MTYQNLQDAAKEVLRGPQQYTSTLRNKQDLKLATNSMSQRLRGKKKNNQNPESAEGRKIKIRTEIKQRAGKQKKRLIKLRLGSLKR